MPSSTAIKTARWSVIGLCGVLALFFAPMALFLASNFGSAMLSLLLNRRPTSTELIGDYILKAPWGRSLLRINPYGTFQQQIQPYGKSKRSVSGQWQARPDSNFVDVDFRPFGMVWDDDHERDTTIYGISFYKPRSGATYGMIDDDLGEKYERQQGGKHDQ